MADSPTEVVVGLRFRSTVVDERVLFEVVEPLAKDYWECRSIGYDEAELLKVFSADEILGGFRLNAIFGRSYDPADYLE